MFESIMKFFKKAIQDEDSKLIGNSSTNLAVNSKSSTGTSSSSKMNVGTNVHSRAKAKERLHLVLVQDRVNVSADFLDLMKQEIIEVIKKYIDIDEAAMDVSLTNRENEDGTKGTPALYANIPILNIKDETRKIGNKMELKKIKDKENPPKKEVRNEENEGTTKEASKEIKKEQSKKVDEKIQEEIKQEIKIKNDKVDNKLEKKQDEEKIDAEKEAV